MLPPAALLRLRPRGNYVRAVPELLLPSVGVVMLGKVAHSEFAGGAVRLPLSMVTLRFEDSKLEHSYQESQRGRQTQFFVCGLAFYFAVLLAAMCALWAYLANETSRQLAVFQACVLSALAAFNTAFFVFIWWVSSQRLKHIGLSVAMLFSAAGFAVSDERFASAVMGTDFSGNSVSCFLLITFIALPFAEMMRHQLALLIATLGLGIVAQAALLMASQRINTTITELLVTCAVLAYLGTRVHEQEKKYRRDFYMDKLDWTSVSEVEEFEQWEHDSLNTERELLLGQLFEAHEIITEVCGASIARNSRNRLKDALKRISSAGNVLRSGRSIDKPDLGKLTKTATAEYKNYLEENCWPQPIGDLKRVHPPGLKVGPVFGEDLQPLLAEIDNNWNFDMIKFAEVSMGRPLQTVGEFCMKKFGFSLVEEKCSRFLQEIEQKYKPNPYHNSTHGADVANSLLFLYQQSPLMKEVAELELLASIVAALCHDVGHPGLSNRYLIAVKSNFALICNVHADNDVSVLEMMHSALTYELLERTDLLSHLASDQWALVRKVVVELILATDMMKHFEVIGAFRAKQYCFPLKDFEERLSAYRLCIKCADVAHACKSEELHEKWTSRVVEEFFHQGDLEREKRLPVSAFCDRYNSDIPTNQCGFILNLVKPMFETLNSLLRSDVIFKSCLEQFDANIRLWKKKQVTEERALLKSRTGEKLEVDESVHV